MNHPVQMLPVTDAVHFYCRARCTLPSKHEHH